MTDQTHGAGRPAYRSGHCHDGCASVFEALGWVGALRLDSRHVRHGRGLMAITLFLPFRLDLDLFPCTHREVGLKETFREEYPTGSSLGPCNRVSALLYSSLVWRATS